MQYCRIVLIHSPFLNKRHPENEDRLTIKKNKQNKKCIIVTEPKLFFYIVATNIQAFVIVWRVLVCLHHRPLPPVHLTAPWWNPSLLPFWSVWHPKIPSILGTSENHLRPSLNNILWRICIRNAQMVFTFWTTLVAWQWGPDQCWQLN